MPKVLSEWEFIISPLGNLIPLYLLHYFRYLLEGKWLRWLYYFLFALSCLYLARFFYSFWLASKIHFYQLTGATVVYAGFLFAFLSEMMLAGLKTYLTKKRTDVWVKEMDYVYLVLGGFGVAISTSRLDVVDQKLTMPEFLGPFVLATALVIRALKARVEINGWNKLDPEEPKSKTRESPPAVASAPEVPLLDPALLNPAPPDKLSIDCGNPSLGGATGRISQ